MINKKQIEDEGKAQYAKWRQEKDKSNYLKAQNMVAENDWEYIKHKLTGYDEDTPVSNDWLYDRQERSRKDDVAKPFYKKQNWFRQWNPVEKPEGYDDRKYYNEQQRKKYRNK